MEYEAVSSTLLLPPYHASANSVKLSIQAGVTHPTLVVAEVRMRRQTYPYQQVFPLPHIQGGEFFLGDRVVSLGTGIPAFGLHGTVIGASGEGGAYNRLG